MVTERLDIKGWIKSTERKSKLEIEYRRDIESKFPDLDEEDIKIVIQVLKDKGRVKRGNVGDCVQIYRTLPQNGSPEERIRSAFPQWTGINLEENMQKCIKELKQQNIITEGRAVLYGDLYYVNGI